MSDRKTAVTTPYTIGTAPFRPGDEAILAANSMSSRNLIGRSYQVQCR